jgi:hypothetical protein
MWRDRRVRGSQILAIGGTRITRFLLYGILPKAPRVTAKGLATPPARDSAV